MQSPILIAFILWLSAIVPMQGAVVPFDDFETYTIGNLHGQGGWTVTNIAGTSQAYVSSNYAYSGTKAMYLYDGDGANNPKAWREPTGGNTTNGQFNFAVKEATVTSGRDYWTIVFSNLGTSTSNFKLSLSSATSLTLYGGATGATSLATVNTTSSNGTYNPAGWNTFSVVFNEASNTASVYLNGGGLPILSSTDSATNWTLGRHQFNAGASTYTDMGVYFDQASQAADWETTNKLRYAPRTLVAPTVWAPSSGFNTKTFATDEDVILQISPTQTRTGNLGVVNGRNVRVIGGDLGATYFAATGQTKSLFMEGLKVNQAVTLSVVNGCPVELIGTKMTGCKEMDAIDVCGTTSGPGADVYVQNCSIKGVHGTPTAHGSAIGLSSISCTAINGLSYNVTITTSTAMTLAVGTHWVIVGATNQPKLNGTYRIVVTGSPKTATVWTEPTRWDNWNPLPAGLTVGTSGSGGYVWPDNPAGSDLHADGYQSMAEGMYNCAYFYKVTIASNAECYLGINQLNTQGMRSLVMTRVNMSANNVWPQFYDSASIYLGTTDQSGGGWGTNGFPVALDRVYVKPRTDRTLVAAVYPGIGTTRNGVNVAAVSTDGDLTVHWPAIMGINGSVTKSTNANGYPGESGYTTKDYADLAGANAPGLNYVSPGYSADTIVPLSMTAVTGTPSITGTITVPVGSAINTLVTRLDVSFTGEGQIIDLTLTDPSGKFGMDMVNKRNVVVKAALTAGTYPVTATATQSGTPANTRSQQFNIQVQ